MARRAIKMPSKAMVNLYDMSQEDGDGGLVNDFTSVYDIGDTNERRHSQTANNGTTQVNNKYVASGVETDYSLVGGLKNLADNSKRNSENRARKQQSLQEGLALHKSNGHQSERRAPDNQAMVLSLASQARGSRKGQGIGRRAFVSMTGLSSGTGSASGQKTGRLSFKDMAQAAKKASTLNMAVDAFKTAGTNKQNSAFYEMAGKARLGHRASELSVSRICIEDGVESGALSSADLDLFRNIKELKD